MKILREGKLYVEKRDLPYFEKIPNFIFHEFDDYFNFDYFISFSSEKAINFFTNSFIINYDEIKNLTNVELKEKIILIKKRLKFMRTEWLKASYKLKKELASNIKRRAVIKYLNYQADVLINYLKNRDFYDKLINNYFNTKTLRKE